MQREVKRIGALFSEKAEVICGRAFRERRTSDDVEGTDVAILDLLGRRPCTADDVAAGLGLHVLDVLQQLDVLVAEAKVTLIASDEKAFYVPAGPDNRPAT